MADVTLAPNVPAAITDPFLLGGYGGMEGLSFGPGWSSTPYLESSDRMVKRSKDMAAADARDSTRTNPYAKSAKRAHVDSVIGARFTLQLNPHAEMLGVSDAVAQDWAEQTESLWELDANSSYFPLDAQRKQNWAGLMRTAYASAFTAGEALATVEWKQGFTSTRTCLSLLDPERLSEPYNLPQFDGNRRMGVERDENGAPIAYHIRERHPSDSVFTGIDTFRWTRHDRYTPWGRPRVLHFFAQDRPDMTRGLSEFTTALLSMRLLQDYLTTELESAAVRATYAAVIESEMDYEEAMKAIGAQNKNVIQGNPMLDGMAKVMAERMKFYRGQEVRFGKSKVAHLLPDEHLKMVQGTPSASAVKDFAEINLYSFASGLGVDYASLTKNYQKTNYSGARAALFDVWRSYEVRRAEFVAGFALPFVGAWLEEKIALTGLVPMLGNQSFYDVRDAICRGSFETWTKPRLDPVKENQADAIFYKMGAMSLKDICATDGRDYRDVLKQRAREKALMDELGLEPQDIDWDILMNMGAKSDDAAANSGGSSGDSGGSSGSSS